MEGKTGRPLVALLSDFGTRDGYVAALKGVIASRCRAELVDLSHEIDPFDVFGAAWFLRSIIAYWPSLQPGDSPVAARCVILAIVDPGVGSPRRILAAEQSGRWLVGPDNGILSLILDEAARIVSVENEDYFLPGGSRTFHGRDRFAPVAAALANGVKLAGLGPELELGAIARLSYEPPEYGPDSSRGTIVAIDRFGNLVTDLEASHLGDLEHPMLIAGPHRITSLRSHYEEEASHEPFLVVGSGGTLEISVREASAADFLHLSRFDRVQFLRRA